MTSVIKEFDPDSEVWCLKFPGRGEVTALPFCHRLLFFSSSSSVADSIFSACFW